jgi:hypothetical protein
MNTYVSRDIKDRIALGDNKYRMTELGGGIVLLTPAPDTVIEEGTAINRELLQVMEDRIVMLMNRVFGELTENPFMIKFTSSSDFSGNGVWNESAGRMEC